MSIIVDKNFYLFILFFFGSFRGSNGIQSEDYMCGVTNSILCVRDALMIVATVAKSINRTVNEIEKYIVKNIQIGQTLDRYVNFEMGLIHSHLPNPQHHVEFSQLNNIDKKYLVDLLLEAHYAMSFFYNSISDIIKMNDVFAFKIDTWFKQIHVNMKVQMICRYRSVLDVYSQQYPSITQIKQIQFSQRKYRTAQSLVHDLHSIIVARLLREWMQRINSVLIKLEEKLIGK